MALPHAVQQAMNPAVAPFGHQFGSSECVLGLDAVLPLIQHGLLFIGQGKIHVASGLQPAHTLPTRQSMCFQTIQQDINMRFVFDCKRWYCNRLL